MSGLLSSQNSKRLNFNLTKKTCLKTTHILGLNLKLPVRSQTGSHTWRAWRHLGERHCSRLVGGRFNKQGNLHTRLVLGNCKTSRSLCAPTRILKVYVEALKLGSISYAIQIVSIIPYYLKAMSLKTAHTAGTMGRTYNQGQESG